jgi:hypothetical protein
MSRFRRSGALCAARKSVQLAIEAPLYFTINSGVNATGDRLNAASAQRRR